MAVRLKKGGTARFIELGAKDGTQFEVPKGFFIDYIRVESVNKIDTGAISVGTVAKGIEVNTLTVTKGAVVEVNTLTVTEGAVTTSGNITVAGATIAVVEDDTVEEVATKIAAGTFTDWTAVADGADVVFTAKATGPKTDVAFTDTGSTGVTATIVVDVEGELITSGNITVAGVTIAILEGDTASGIATKIAAGTYTDWTAVAEGAVVTFTAKTVGNKTNVTFVDTGTTTATATIVAVDGAGGDVVANVELPATGVAALTLLKTSFSDDQALYVGVTNASTANVYVGVQKYD